MIERPLSPQFGTRNELGCLLAAVGLVACGGSGSIGDLTPEGGTCESVQCDDAAGLYEAGLYDVGSDASDGPVIPLDSGGTDATCKDGLCDASSQGDATPKDGASSDGSSSDASLHGGHDGASPDAPFYDGGVAPDGGEPDTGMYAQSMPSSAERQEEVHLATGDAVTILFTWTREPGLAPPLDLSVLAGGRPLFQVASVGDHPFARAGLDVEPLEPGRPYALLLERSEDSFDVALVADGETIVDTKTSLAPDPASDTPTAAIVLPAPQWRSSIVADFANLHSL
jgi:hypothetical protein